MNEPLKEDALQALNAPNQINPDVLQNISVTLSIEVGRAMIDDEVLPLEEI